MAADRQLVGQQACHAEKYLGRNSLVPKSEEFIV